MDLQNWSNAANGALSGGLSFGKAMSLRFDYWLHARASADDSWYNAGGKALLAAADAPDNDELLLGHEVDGSFKWVVNKHVKLIDGIGLFVPTGFASEVGGDPQLWAFCMLIVSL